MGNQNSWSEINIGQGKRILVADHEATARLTLCQSLQRFGFQVLTAKCGSETLHFMQSQDVPDLIVLDILMPEMDGFTLAHEIRKHSDVPIVVLSSIADVETRIFALIEFAQDYVAKPFHVEELALRIWRILSLGAKKVTQPSALESRNDDTACRWNSDGKAFSMVNSSSGHRRYANARPAVSW